ncbi:MAG: ABC transporter substrate-binding protein [Actinopolymorphaceae bacterium]
MNARTTSRIRRRDLLASGVGILGASALTSCSFLETDPDAGKPRRSTTAKGKEAPMLADQVKAGKLPPVDNRLPTDRLVVEPTDRIGTYGGEWHSVLEGSPTGDFGELPTTVGYEGLTRWDPQFTKVIPNVALRFEVEDDGRTLTMALRKGMRWSDGKPFTADDLLFAYNDVSLNEELSPVPPGFAVSGGRPATLAKVDDQTVRFSFSVANGLFLQYLATPGALNLSERPRHYLAQFHKTHNKDVDALAEKEGFPSWVELFFAKADLWQNTELPRVHAWVPTNSASTGQRMTFERNPYYWKVDPEGSQLPYLDNVVFQHVNNHQVSLLKASNGEMDFEARRFYRDYAQKPVLAGNREKGNFDFVDLRSMYAVSVGLYLNLTHKDPVKREIFRNKDFRIGLSHAINRKEIISTVFQGQGVPHQVAPLPESPYYDEEMATQFTAYDVDKANTHLDRAGYTERDGSGIRLGPDGKKISFAVDVASDREDYVGTVELMRVHLAEVGIDLHTKAESVSLIYERIEANAHDAVSRTAEGGGGILPHLRTDFWFASESEARNYAPLWSTWYTSRGESGEKPPTDVVRQMEIYQQRVRPATDEEVRMKAMRELLVLTKKLFFCIGICRATNSFGIVRNDFHNVPEEFPIDWFYPCPAPTNPEQYFTTAER